MMSDEGKGKPKGYGNPPDHTKFKKGESGNPSGRPKGTTKVEQIIKKLEKQKVWVTENGTKKKMTKIELVVSALFSKASKGDVQAAKLLLSWKAKAEESGQVSDHGFDEADLQVLLEEADWLELVKTAAENSGGANEPT